MTQFKLKVYINFPSTNYCLNPTNVEFFSSKYTDLESINFLYSLFFGVYYSNTL